jgi:hypothetical protein
MSEIKIGIMQPYFFPYIGYFQLINAVDKFIIYDDVNFINRGWINRNRILINGKESFITIPLHDASQNKLINQIEILNETKWKVKILRSIEQNYKKAPHFSIVFELIYTIINKGYTHISTLNLESIQTVCDYLELNTKIVSSSTHYENKNLSGQSRIIDICQKERANQYINPIGGVELYNRKLFEEKKIRLNFIHPTSVPYPQTVNCFTPYLSIIDILMNCEPNYIKTNLLNVYNII